MTAICKTKLIHGSNLQPLLDYGENQEKTSYTENALKDTLDYAANPLKTLADMDDGDKELLVSGVLCEPSTALLDFAAVREKYLEIHGSERIYRYEYFDKRTGENRNARRDPVTAIHLIQSFSEKNIDPRTVHQIGIELCNKLGVMAVVDTHMNTDHLHNHIIINAYLPGGERKFVMETATILRIRELSDQLQQEHGIELKFDTPRKQLYYSKEHDTYGEWSARKNNLSWKEEMKDEITAAKSVSDSREDFIAIMEDYGYTIARQEAESITWWNKDHTRKIRDRTLGDAYGLGSLFPSDSPEYTIKPAATPDRKHPKPLSVTRYDWNGRRRSDLELLIRKAIALILHAGNRYSHPHTAPARSPSYKVEMMEQALETVRGMGLGSKAELKEKLHDVGANLSHVKSELRKMEAHKNFYDTVEPMIAAMQSTRHTVDSIRHWAGGEMHDLMHPDFSAADAAKTKASLFPMTGTQKRELYLALQEHKEFTLAGNGFSDISAMDAEEIFAYFKGTRKDRPACLKDSVQVTMDRVYQKHTSFLRASFTKPVKEYQKKHLAELLRREGYSADMDSLTQFDAINIENCLGENPFSEPPIDPEKQLQLSRRLQGASLTLNRDIAYILPTEYDAVMDYLDGIRRTKPPVLKQSPRIDEMTADKLQTFMDARGITCSIPVTELSKADYNKMYGYVLSHGRTPDCAAPVPPAPTDRTADFHKTIAANTEKKQLLLTHLRNQANELLKLGIDPDNTEAVQNEIATFRESYSALEKERLSLNEEYKSLIRLDKQITYAETPAFLFGSLFSEKVHKAPEVLEKEERDQKPEQEITDHRKTPAHNIDPDL